jgi:hypothetical protein
MVMAQMQIAGVKPDSETYCYLIFNCEFEEKISEVCHIPDCLLLPFLCVFQIERQLYMFLKEHLVKLYPQVINSICIVKFCWIYHHAACRIFHYILTCLLCSEMLPPFLFNCLIVDYGTHINAINFYLLK